MKNKIVGILVCVGLMGFVLSACGAPKKTAREALNLWNEGAQSTEQLISYMDSVTNEKGEDFIPPEDRVAVFDLDGTLLCETDPVYFDHMLFMHRVMEDPDHEPGEFELEVAEKVQEFIDTGSYPSGLDNEHGQGVATAFAGMTLDEFEDYVRAYMQEPAEGYTGMTKGEAFYAPMLQVVNYLVENDFRVYVVSGTDRFIVRPLVENSLPIPPSQAIGSDESLEATSQNGADGLDYLFTKDDQLVLGGEFLIKNLKMNKVTVIMQEIGQQPVLSFGNSSGDASMAEYVTSNNPHKSLAFMLCCDDTERENGNPEKAAKMLEMCDEQGWIPVSMKDDWSRIYAEGVTKK